MGYKKENLVGKTHRELGFGENLCDLWEEKITHVFKSKEPAGEIFTWESAEGPVFLDWRLFPEFDQEGNVKTVLEVSRDITEQKKLESQLRQSQKMEAIGTLAGGIAHDFNNLLSPILGYAQLARIRLDSNSKEVEYLRNIEEAANRAKDLVQKILIISRSSLADTESVQLKKPC